MAGTAVEAQTCPRRVGELGPWERGENLDRWERDRWHLTQEAANAAAEEFERKYPGGSMSRFYWSDGEPPRTCSFCGGVHPDDAIALVRRGWVVEATTKGYKRYLHPPGYFQQSAAFTEWLRNGREGERPPSVDSPVPPVKLYVMHFSAEQVTAFNEAIAGRFHHP